MLHGDRSRPAGYCLLLAALLFQGVSGVAGGAGLIADPTGRALGIPAEWLVGSPFPDYLLPGVVLFVVLGIGPLIAAYGLRTRAAWGWVAALGTGIALTGWIGIEILVIGYQPRPPLQLVYGTLAVLIVALALLPSVRVDAHRP